MEKIKLTQGEYAIVDWDDFRKLSKHKWHAHKRHNLWYALRTINVNSKQKTIRMHRLVLKAKEGDYVDHINGNGLDNRKNNLRLCNHKQNAANSRISKNNTSGYKGVCWDKSRSKWIATIRVNYRKLNLGRYDNILDAAAAYDRYAIMWFGEFAKTNGVYNG